MSGFSYLSTPRNCPYFYETIVEAIQNKAEATPDKVICIERRLDGSRRTMQYNQLMAKSTKMAKFLVSKGISKGKKVAILGPSSLECIYGLYGTLMSGAVVVNIAVDARADPKRLYRMTLESGCNVLLLDPGYNGQFVSVMSQILLENEQNNNTCEIIYLRKCEDCNKNIDFDTILKMDLSSVELPRVFPEEVAEIYATSGSTGPPKFVQHTHFGIRNQYSSLPFVDQIQVAYNDRPFGWAGGSPIPFLIQGKTLVFSDAAVSSKTTNTEAIWKIIQEEKCTHAIFMLYYLNEMLRNKDKYSGDWKLRCIITSGQVLPEYHKGVLGIFCDAILVVYSSTESAQISYKIVTPITDYVVGDVGIPSSGAEIKIIGEDNKVLRLEQTGEICTRSRYAFRAYIGLEELMKKVRDKDGWYRTGDLGRITKSGNLVLEGRLDDVISRNFLRIVPAPIENEIMKMPGIKEVLLVGVPDKNVYEELCICYVPETNADIKESDVREFCKSIKFQNGMGESQDLIPPYIMKFDKLALNAAGKFNRKQIRSDVVKMLGLEGL